MLAGMQLICSMTRKSVARSHQHFFVPKLCFTALLATAFLTAPCEGLDGETLKTLAALEKTMKTWAEANEAATPPSKSSVNPKDPVPTDDSVPNPEASSTEKPEHKQKTVPQENSPEAAAPTETRVTSRPYAFAYDLGNIITACRDLDDFLPLKTSQHRKMLAVAGAGAEALDTIDRLCRSDDPMDWFDWICAMANGFRNVINLKALLIPSSPPTTPKDPEGPNTEKSIKKSKFRVIAGTFLLLASKIARNHRWTASRRERAAYALAGFFGIALQQHKAPTEYHIALILEGVNAARHILPD
jgi:hypothetical protein